MLVSTRDFTAGNVSALPIMSQAGGGVGELLDLNPNT